MKRFFSVMTIVSLGLFPGIAFGQVIFSEIMYDLPGTDTKREWVEVQNISTEPVDISDWKLFEADTNHKLTSVQGDTVLSPQAYAIIADDSTSFLNNNPGYAGILFDSTFSLNNAGETLILRDKDAADVNALSYQPSLGAAGDGLTLQSVGGIWGVGSPTPGLPNAFTAAVSTSSATSTVDTSTATTTDSGAGTATSTSSGTASSVSTSGSVSTHSAPEEVSSGKVLVRLFEISAGRERLSYAGSSVSFGAKSRVSADLENQPVRYAWSFGDGATAEGGTVSHAYLYPGEYAVVLNADVADMHAVSRTVVKVLAPMMAIRLVPGEGIEVENKGKNEINLEGYVLTSGTQKFVVPRDTIVLGMRKILFGQGVTSISSAGGDSLRLVSPAGKEIAVASAVQNTMQPSTSLGTTSIAVNEIEIRARIAAILNRPIPAVTEEVMPAERPEPKVGVVSDGQPPTPISSDRESEKENGVSQAASIIVIEPPASPPGLFSRSLAWIRGLFGGR